MGQIILVTGGARSGKSSFAERYAGKLANDGQIAYIATARVDDDEMEARVRLHRARRPDTWNTFEAPLNADQVIAEVARSHKVILFDCITLYLSNYLLSLPEDRLNKDSLGKDVKSYIQGLLQPLAQTDVTAIFVTNEVGSGIVPENKLARLYRDMSGLANQEIAQSADRIFMVVSGIAVDIKKIAEEI